MLRACLRADRGPRRTGSQAGAGFTNGRRYVVKQHARGRRDKPGTGHLQVEGREGVYIKESVWFLALSLPSTRQPRIATSPSHRLDRRTDVTAQCQVAYSVPTALRISLRTWLVELRTQTSVFSARLERRGRACQPGSSRRRTRDR